MAEPTQLPSVEQAIEAALATGDTNAAMRVVYTWLHRDRYRFLRAAVGSSVLSVEECEDLLHEVALTILPRLRDGSMTKVHAGLLRQVILFAWVGQLRRRYGRRKVLEWVAAEDLPEPHDERATPEESAIHRQEMEAFNRSVQALPRAERDAFRIFASGVPGTEAASQLGIELNTYQQRVARARRRLRICNDASIATKETTDEPE